MSQTTHAPIIDRRQRGHSGTGNDPQIKTGLKWKLAALILFVICGMSLLSILFFQFSFKKAMVHEFQKRGASLAEGLANSLIPILPVTKAKIPEAMIASYLLFPDVLYVVVQDPDGDRLFARAQSAELMPLPLTAEQLSLSRLWRQKRTLAGGLQVSDFVAPVWDPPLGAGPGDPQSVRKGTVRIGLSAKAMDKHFRNISLLLAGGTGVLLVLGLILSLLLSQFIINPIQRLARAMKIVAIEEEEFDENGKPIGRRFRRMNDVELKIRTGDEIEQLADEFRVMVMKLENSYTILEKNIADKSRIALEKSLLAEDLKEMNRKNEALVKERTREVVEKNLRLYEISEELQFQKDELISMNEQLEKSSRMKSEFLASMSHELRTPLNSIIGFAEVLREKMFGDLNERQEKYLSNILASGQHLLQLVNNILDIAKVEAGKMKLNVEPFTINRVIEEVHNIIRTLAYKKNIELTLDLAPEVVIQGDAAKFKQILYNLLSNAIKFTDEKGRVVIRTQRMPAGTAFQGGPGAAPFETQSEAILMVVADNGIGIKPEDQERIFREFEQADQTRKRKYEGTGLGLALTRKLVHLHGGNLWVQSKVGEGTEMMVVLPLAAPVEESGDEEKPLGPMAC